MSVHARSHPWPVVLLGIVCLGAVGAAQQADEELAVRRFQSGLAFVQDGNYEEALEDFQAVVTLYPASTVVDNALLEIARYHLEVRGALDQAVATADGIVNSQAYSQGDAAPEAYVILGRAALARGRSDADIQDAISSFQRGLRLYPDAPAVSQSLFYIAEGQRMAGRTDAALAAYPDAPAVSQWRSSILPRGSGWRGGPMRRWRHTGVSSPSILAIRGRSGLGWARVRWRPSWMIRSPRWRSSSG